ncbi:MAG: VWA domain-containing protein [Akkermansiaceae bacterium]|nr:VWA domain-containing protein [Akkermansiaceae bacterium]
MKKQIVSNFAGVNKSPLLRPQTFLAVLISAFAALASAEVKKTDVFDYKIYYHPDYAVTNDFFASDEDAQDIADFYDPSSGTGLHQTYINLGFRAPEFRNIFGPVKPTILLEAAPFTLGRANTIFPDRIVLPPDTIRNRYAGFGTVRNKDLCAHELSHIVQYQYMAWGLDLLNIYPMAIEGTATAMEDTLDSDVDAGNLADDFDHQSDFAHLANNYLVTDSSSAFTFKDNITDSGDFFWGGDGYHSGLFWKYLMEQYGTSRTEPGFGVDAMERFYELAGAHLDDGMGTLIQRLLTERNRYTTSASDPGVELAELFQDFTIANRLSGPDFATSTFSVSDSGRFKYSDDIVVNSGAVPVTTFGPLAVATNTGTQSAKVARYAAKYVTCSFAAPPNNTYGVGFFAQSNDSSKTWFTVAGERTSGIIDFVYKGSVHPDEDNAHAYATMTNTTDPYVRFHVIATGDDAPPPGAGFSSTSIGFDFNFACFQPTLTVKEPSTSYRAYVGDAAAPERFLVKLSVTSPSYLGTGSVNGLDKSQFTVYVGTAVPSNQATVLSAAYVLGEYWLTCQAPVKSPAPTTVQTLVVKLGGVTATVENTVVYATLNVDQMIVIDRSGSMTTTSGGVQRITAARAAAQLFIDSSGSDDQIGVARFNGNGEVIPAMNLNPMSSQLERDLWSYIIDEANTTDQLAATGSTSIGDGVLAATNDIIANGVPTAEKWITLLSDGHQNETTTWEDQVAAVTAQGIHVEAIALGSGCDNNLLQSIATESKGKFYEVAAPNDPPSSAMSRKSLMGSASGTPMLLDLANNFLLSSERIHRRERIVEKSATLAAGATVTETLTLAEGGLTDCVVTVFADVTNSIGLAITRPDASTVPAPDAGSATWDPDRYVNYRISAMGDGTWTFSIHNSGAASAKYFFVVAGKNRQGVTTHVYFTQFHGNNTIYNQNGLYLRGLPMPIVAVLNDGNGQVRGATVLAKVTHPSRAPVTLLLRDDGGGYDGVANDGVYAGLYRATTEYSYSGLAYAEGTPPTVTPSYQVVVTSTGKDNLARNFQRVSRGAFNIYETENGGDTDGDAMPDRYESLHAGLNPTLNDAATDIDGDGLTNLQEYLLGTDPGLMDTDGGGETDGSENSQGANPWDRRDDAVPNIIVAHVIERIGDAQPPTSLAYIRPAPSQNVVHFSVEKGVSDVDVFRATAVNGAYALAGSVNTATSGGIFLDTGLTNGTTYFYYVQPRTATGRIGKKSTVFYGTPRSDSQPPEGGILLNNGNLYTTSTNVSVSFSVTPDVTEQKVSTTLSGVSAAAWNAYTGFIPAFPLGATTSGTTRTVYARVRDAAGNETPIVSAITYLAPASAATVKGTVVTPLDPDARKVVVSLKSTTTNLQYSTGPTGVFTIPIPSGTYNIVISQSGYQSYTMTGATLAAGTTLNLGTITLASLDADGDGLADASELRTYGTNRYDSDTDDDGQNDGVEITVLITDPKNPNSLLRIEGTPVVNGAAGTATITFQSVSGVSYHFQSSANLATWVPVLDGGVPKTVTATATSTTVTLNFPANAAKRFFRVSAP